MIERYDVGGRRSPSAAGVKGAREPYAWVLTGRVCDFGPDHEPLVADFRTVAALSDDLLKEAEERYHDRFEVGRDSLQ